jgi:hypothetical protein
MTHTKGEALKLALEALESCGKGHITDGGNQWHDAKLVDKAITAIEQALAAPVQEPVACKTLCELCVKRGYNFCANAVKTTPIPTPPAQQAPVQEPVAIALNTGTKQGVKWLKNVEHSENLYTTLPAQQAPVQQILEAFPLLDDEGLDQDEHHCEWALQQDRKRLHAMLTTPPAAQRQWVEMSDARIKGIFSYHGQFASGKDLPMLRVIEAMIKENTP